MIACKARLPVYLSAMPELPEVETARRDVVRAARGGVIRDVLTVEDSIVYDGVTPVAVAKALTGRRFIDMHRRGKHLWMELDRRPWPLFHFGMTGWLHVYRNAHERPRFWKIEMVFDNGVRVALRDPRRLGRIRLRNDPAGEPPISLLGFDPVHDLPGAAFFRDELGRRKAPVKAVLLDQSFSAGVGNWIADEVLYQSGIDPQRRACDLGAQEVKKLRANLKKIVDYAVSVGSDDTKFPKTWLFHYRWGKTKNAVDGRGRTISFGTVGGRTTAWVPTVQKPGAGEARATSNVQVHFLNDALMLSRSIPSGRATDRTNEPQDRSSGRFLRVPPFRLRLRSPRFCAAWLFRISAGSGSAPRSSPRP